MFAFLKAIEFSGTKTVIVLCAVAAVAAYDLVHRVHHRRTHLLFAVILGSVLSLGLMRIVAVFLEPGTGAHPVVAGVGFLLVLLCWRALFGPWDVQTKTALLGTFLFWISLHIMLRAGDEQVTVRLIAAGVALMPAIIWCRLFLLYHWERRGVVVLLFLSGILATVPILFYDALVRRGVEMHFLFFRIQPESFSQTAQQVVMQRAAVGGGDGRMMALLISFLFVGLIEEVSKYWVLSRSGQRLFTSIDDVLQLSIIAAIGFAFAENVVNPVYFTAFVRDFLFHGAAPDVSAFISNVLGRSVLTSMVHIVSTGVMGYFLGLAIFAGPYLAEQRMQGRLFRILNGLHRLLRLPEVSLFRVQMLATGLIAAIGLHGLFNFLVTLPEMLPGNPQSIADIIGPSAPSFLSAIPFLLIPALFYVVGGFWLLTVLFARKASMQERGHLVTREVWVAEERVAA